MLLDFGMTCLRRSGQQTVDFLKQSSPDLLIISSVLTLFICCVVVLSYCEATEFYRGDTESLLFNVLPCCVCVPSSIAIESGDGGEQKVQNGDGFARCALVKRCRKLSLSSASTSTGIRYFQEKTAATS